MRNHTKRRIDHNYKKKVLRFVMTHRDSFPVGEVTKIDVKHDDWCAIFKGGVCNCNPIIKRG